MSYTVEYAESVKPLDEVIEDKGVKGPRRSEGRAVPARLRHGREDRQILLDLRLPQSQRRRRPAAAARAWRSRRRRRRSSPRATCRPRSEEPLRPEDDIRELFAPTGAVDIRRMFGGHGVFRDGRMIRDRRRRRALAQDRFDLPRRLRGRGIPPFSFPKSDGSVTVLSYWAIPEEGAGRPGFDAGLGPPGRSRRVRASLAGPPRKRRAAP